jgi:hypothetical protein
MQKNPLEKADFCGMMRIIFSFLRKIHLLMSDELLRRAYSLQKLEYLLQIAFFSFLHEYRENTDIEH